MMDVIKNPIAVMAGSPTDAGMGAEFYKRQGLRTQAFPLGKSGKEQNRFMLLPPEQRLEKVCALVGEIKAAGYSGILVYCNALSAAVDMAEPAKQYGLPIITPLQAYGQIAAAYRKLAVFAANGQSLAAIERSIYAAKGDIDLVLAADMSVVQAIEQSLPPREIISRFGLDKLAAYFNQNQVEAIILGCTHFPYLQGDWQALSAVPLLDPAMVMLESLQKALAD